MDHPAPLATRLFLALLLLALAALACRRAAPSTTPFPTVDAEATVGAAPTEPPANALTPEATGAPVTPTEPAPTSTKPPGTEPATGTPGTGAAPAQPFGYGWDVAFYAAFQPASGMEQYPPTTFNWIKIVQEPEQAQFLCGEFRLPQRVLLRLNRAAAGVTPFDVGAHAASWASSLREPGGDRCVDAFEIGNEPNLAGSGMFGGRVDPVGYADQLCAAYDAIKAVDPGFLVISGGLAMTGGDTPDYQDEETFTRWVLSRVQALRGDPGACFDALGVHNYGFRTGFATDPNDPAACPDGQCFRGAERLAAVLNEFGAARPIWSTGFGWARDFTAACAAAPWAGPFNGFAQSDQAQAENLTGAFAYARANWPWMGAMFVANLDYQLRPWQPDPCADPDGWFGVKGFPAEAALEAMPKP